MAMRLDPDLIASDFNIVYKVMQAFSDDANGRGGGLEDMHSPISLQDKFSNLSQFDEKAFGVA